MLKCLQIFSVALLFVTQNLWAQETKELSNTAKCSIELELKGAIGPASLDLLTRGFEMAKVKECASLIVTINTPGGSLETTRLIVTKILNSPIPVLCLVYPSGGHAGSAGAIILQACHVNGAMEATNLGAATPVSGGGEAIPEDLRKKLLNDTRSWMDGITKLRNRNEKFGQDIILEAKAVSAEEAKKIGAIDFMAKTKQEFLDFAVGREVQMSEDLKQIVAVGPVEVFQPDLRHQALSLLTDPQIAYLIFMGSLGLLYFEITHPGTMVAGVVGAVGLVVSMVAMHKLNVEWGGLVLIFLGVILLVAEVFVPSFGILGLGGVTSFVVGSIFLYDPAKTGGYTLPLSTILPSAFLLALITFGLGYLAVRSLKVKKRGGFDDMLNLVGTVVELQEDSKSGLMEVRGELWKFSSSKPVQIKSSVKVTGHLGFTLNVEPEGE